MINRLTETKVYAVTRRLVENDVPFLTAAVSAGEIDFTNEEKSAIEVRGLFEKYGIDTEIELNAPYIFVCKYKTNKDLMERSTLLFYPEKKHDRPSDAAFGGMYEGKFEDGSHYAVYGEELYKMRKDVARLVISQKAICDYVATT